MNKSNAFFSRFVQVDKSNAQINTNLSSVFYLICWRDAVKQSENFLSVCVYVMTFMYICIKLKFK